VLVQGRDRRAAGRLMRKLLRKHGRAARTNHRQAQELRGSKQGSRAEPGTPITQRTEQPGGELLQRKRATEAAGTQAGLRGMGNRNGQLDAGSFLADTGMARTKSQVRVMIHPRRDRTDIETYLARLNFDAMPKPGLSFDNFFKPILRAVPYEPVNCRRGIIVNRRAVHREYPVDIIFLNLF
jgi:hypothetical protein